MYMNQYQHKAHEYAEYDEPIYPWLALGEEAGEVLGKLAKNKRGDRKYLNSRVLNEALAKELGDVLWQLQECAGQLGFSLDEIATMNLKKLWDRKERDCIKGDGDER